MSGVQTCSCVGTQVPSSFSFHSITVRPTEYDPGLAALTLRIHNNTKIRRRSSEDGRKGEAGEQRRSAWGELRVVHGTADVHRVLEEAVDKVWGSGGEEKGGTEKNVESNVSPEGFWSIRTGESILDQGTKEKFILELFCGLCNISWDIVSSCSLTHTTSLPQVYELFTWILKKQVVPISGLECVGISLRKEEDEHVFEVLTSGDGSNLEVNNVLKYAVAASDKHKGQHKHPTPSTRDGHKSEKVEKAESSDKAKDATKQGENGKTSESGYISEEDKKSEDEKESRKNESAEDDAKVEEDIKVENGIKVEDEEVVETAEDALAYEDLEDIEQKVDEESNHESKDNQRSDTDKIEPDETKEESTKTKETETKGESTEESQPKKSIKSAEDSPMKGIVLRNKSLLNSALGGQQRFRESQDDPLCPGVFRTTGDLSSILLHLSYTMFSRQWKLVSATRIEDSDSNLLLFQHDSRILPGIGQQILAGLCIGKTGVRIINVEEETREAVCKDLGLVGDQTDQPTYAPEDGERMYSQSILSFSKHSLSLFNIIQSYEGDLLMFRPSNLVSTAGMTMGLLRGNTIRLYGATLQDVNVIREVIRSRWPYAIEHDLEVARVEARDALGEDATGEDKKASGEDTEAKDEQEDMEKILTWEWKLRRYPWRVSYGARLVDWAVERVGKVISLSTPKHQDLESAESLVIFSIKEFSERGWKFSGVISTPPEIYIQFLK